MKFNPEDNYDFGPHCRNCHKGSTACNTCHQNFISGVTYDLQANATDATGKRGLQTAYTPVGATTDPATGFGTSYDVFMTSTGESNMATNTLTGLGSTWTFGFVKHSRTVTPDTADWRSSADKVAMNCSDDGFSWPHRTLGWKMLKDDLFGIDFTGNLVGVGETRSIGSTSYKVHDVDSVCLDCHNPTVWGATSVLSHTDTTATATDDNNDELLTRGLP